MAHRPSANSHPLVEELAERLRGPRHLQEPFLIEDRIPQTRSRHVVVIWDAWEELDPAQRSVIIADAFAESGRLGDDTITVAMGLTQREALDYGYLPYSIATARRREDAVSDQELRSAMESIGAVVERAGSSLRLRFPTLEHAEEAYRLLQDRLPGPHWVIREEVGAGSSSGSW